jgi:hypothetical protein
MASWPPRSRGKNDEVVEGFDDLVVERKAAAYLKR